MLTITLVRSCDGRLAGKTFSDRWNLDQLGYQYVNDDKNQASLKKIRRLHGTDFRFTVVSGTMEDITIKERVAMGSRFLSRLFGKTA